MTHLSISLFIVFFILHQHITSDLPELNSIWKVIQCIQGKENEN